jgi:hypothetical protein
MWDATTEAIKRTTTIIETQICDASKVERTTTYNATKQLQLKATAPEEATTRTTAATTGTEVPDASIAVVTATTTTTSKTAATQVCVKLHTPQHQYKQQK